MKESRIWLHQHAVVLLSSMFGCVMYCTGINLVFIFSSMYLPDVPSQKLHPVFFSCLYFATSTPSHILNAAKMKLLVDTERFGWRVESLKPSLLSTKPSNERFN